MPKSHPIHDPLHKAKQQQNLTQSTLDDFLQPHFTMDTILSDTVIEFHKKIEGTTRMRYSYAFP